MKSQGVEHGDFLALISKGVRPFSWGCQHGVGERVSLREAVNTFDPQIGGDVCEHGDFLALISKGVRPFSWGCQHGNRFMSLTEFDSNTNGHCWVANKRKDHFQHSIV